MSSLGTFYGVVNSKNEPLGIDQNSGGYPWVPDHPSGIHLWTRREGAEKYIDSFKNSPSCQDRPVATCLITVKFGF